MKRKFSFLPALLALLVFQNCSQNKSSSLAEADLDQEYYSAEDFASVKKIDAHIHIRTNDTVFINQAIEDNFQLINIDVYKEGGTSAEEQRELAVKYLNNYPDNISYATTFSLENWDEDIWQQQTINHLEKSFALGAIGVKVWKNIGMELRDKNGNFVMVDNPQLDPIFDYIAQNKITLLSHQGEPKDCWLPLDKMSIKSNRNYFAKHPEYHMHLHAEYPSYEEQIQARDNMLAKHPDLRVVSVHLASLEWSVEEIAKRLDKFPNLAVDMAARIPHLQLQAKENWQQVHDFFIKYQDRILYATDFVITDQMQNSLEMQKRVYDRWVDDWKFFATDELLTSVNFEGEYKGLKLPKEVINKIYYQNAAIWIPKKLAVSTGAKQ
jgi:predicted TIM-barrel fold metal-dependent hydrolase